MARLAGCQGGTPNGPAAAHACRALCRARVVAEMYQRRGTRLAEHLKLVLSIIDRAGPTGGAPR
jgi:hypothetical protein